MGEEQQDALKVVEMFYSIQGESSFIGKPCLFIRLHGCNLRCSYCDTKYAYDDNSTFKELSIDVVLQEALQCPAPVVEITGGEPLVQMDGVLQLCLELVKRKTILIETNGSISLRPFSRHPTNLHIIMDVKTPSSGMHEKLCTWNLENVYRGDQFKFVVGSREDFEYAKKICYEYGLHSGVNEVLISPVFGAVQLQDLAEWVLDEMPFARMQVQLHKIIWDPAQRGV